MSLLSICPSESSVMKISRHNSICYCALKVYSQSLTYTALSYILLLSGETIKRFLFCFVSCCCFISERMKHHNCYHFMDEEIKGFRS